MWYVRYCRNYLLKSFMPLFILFHSVFNAPYVCALTHKIVQTDVHLVYFLAFLWRFSFEIIFIILLIMYLRFFAMYHFWLLGILSYNEISFVLIRLIENALEHQTLYVCCMLDILILRSDRNKRMLR